LKNPSSKKPLKDLTSDSLFDLKAGSTQEYLAGF
jgi:hypothetical protein